ncbi:MAG: 2-succinyl-6-hydroxy-2,4-cyclohexadiene-1-carboxylate synthase [Chloroflexia bacterium]
MSLLKVNGVRYNVECAGEGEALLLLHGFTGSAATWVLLTATWARRFHTIAVDLLGHGGSDAPTDPARYGMEPTVADLAALLDVLGVERAYLLGYSMGGRVALHSAAAHPQRVGALILESASPGLADPSERAARVTGDEALADGIERKGVPTFVARWEALPLWASQARLPEATRERLHTQRLANSALGLANSLRGLGTGAHPPLYDRLPALPMPTLLITGELDPKFTAIARAMSAAMPNAQMAVVPNAGHAVHLEQPGAFGTLVTEFLMRKEQLSCL